MAKKSLQINKFDGGLNSYSDSRDLKENEFQTLDNAVVDEHGIIRVSGALVQKTNMSEYFSGALDSISPGKGLFTTPTDYLGDFVFQGYSSMAFNGTFQVDENSLNDDGLYTEAIGIHNDGGGGTWYFGSSEYFSPECPSHAYNNPSLSEGENPNTRVMDYGLLRWKLQLVQGKEYKIRFTVGSQIPCPLTSATEFPRIRLFDYETL